MASTNDMTRIMLNTIVLLLLISTQIDRVMAVGAANDSFARLIVQWTRMSTGMQSAGVVLANQQDVVFACLHCNA